MNLFEKIEALKKEYVFFKHLFLDFSDYPNLVISFPIGLFLILACVAFCAAVFVLSYREAVMAKTVKQLLRHDALSEDSAKTLSALRLYDAKAVKKALSSSGKLSNVVLRAGYEKPSYEEYMKGSKEKKKALLGEIDFDSAKFYLNPEYRKLADKMAANGRSTVWKPVVISAVLIVIFAVLFIVMPNILELMNAWLA